ncbi:uncharacterized protein LOC120010560 [Tripterygium wilfordii]|uniref:uncharacterized protein LOC120010560 n=1 Tax=Tripterygium wilfordii TaxID=458696 RepID=UPI0018F850C1|nr:uncharacterized protein LOC120010560 [Tripterygium wilfordii]
MESTIPSKEIDVTDDVSHATRTRVKAGESQLFSPLKRFSKKGQKKSHVSKSKSKSHKSKEAEYVYSSSLGDESESKSLQIKDETKEAEYVYSNSSGDESESKSHSVKLASRKWADYTSSLESESESKSLKSKGMEYVYSNPSYEESTSRKWDNYIPTLESDILVPVMMTEATSSEDQVKQMNVTIDQLTKSLEEKDKQIAALINRLDSLGPITEPSRETFVSREEQDRLTAQNALHDSTNLSVASLSVNQLQNMIVDTIRAQYGGAPQSSLVYAKPYSRRIDEIRMPWGYQPPKFQQFDGKGNPKQHVAHFIETCNNAGTFGDSMVKQFVRSLKGAAFEWYTDLPAGFIEGWDQLEREFLTRFYSTRRTVSLPELARMRQNKEEAVVEYIERWRNLVLNCKERISESSSIDMCVQGMHWGLLYNLQANMPHSFEELATRAHDLEIQIARHGSHLPSDPRELKKEVKKDSKPSRTKESMAVTTDPVKISTQKSKSKFESKTRKDQTQVKERPTLKQMQEKEYPFADSEVSGILDQLLEQKLIELPTSKRPEEIGQTDNPKYCKYHRIIGHPIEKCFVFKDIIMRLNRENKIDLDLTDNVEVNCGMVAFGSFDPIPISMEAQTMPSSITNEESSNIELTAELPEGAVRVQFIVDGEATTVYAYPGMPRPQAPNRPTLYEIMTDDLDVWDSSPEMYDSSSESEDEGWIEVKSKRQYSSPIRSLPSPIPILGRRENKKSRSKNRLRRNRRKTHVEVENESTHSTPRKKVTLKEYFPKDYFLDEHMTSYVISAIDSKESHEERDGSKMEASSIEKKGVVISLQEIPSDMNISEVLELPIDTRLALVQTLLNPEEYKGKIFSQIRKVSPGDCMATITFTDDDLQLGTRLHNRPLYVSGIIREHKISRILIDCGSAVNIMPIHTMRKIGISVNELSKSKLTIQGFNQKGQRAIGTVRLKIEMDDLISSALFHVIDSKTSYELLLGRVWLHENGVIPSTWHQCFKYSRNGKEKCIVAESKPFASEESHFADAKFYQKEDMPQEALPVLIPESKNDVKDDSIEDILSRTFVKESSKIELSKRDVDILKEDLILPIPSIGKIVDLNSIQENAEEAELPKTLGNHSNGWFDPRVKKLMENAGYGKGKPCKLGDLDSVLSSGKAPVINKQGISIPQPKHGLGHESRDSHPIRIRAKKASANPIMIQIFEYNDDKPVEPLAQSQIQKQNTRISVFERIGDNPSTSNQMESVQKVSVFSRLGPKVQKEDPKKRRRQRRRRRNALAKDKGKNKVIVSVNHITIEEVTEKEFSSDSSSDEEPISAPSTLEDGGQATVDELKEINLGTEADPRPTFVSALLSPEEETKYIQLLQEYMDVFAWTYKEMPGLDPKIVVHHLSIKHGVRPIKQAQRRFRPELVPKIENEVNKLIEAGFIREVKYPTWIANIVPVMKKNGQLRVCVDFRDLNKACPKDDFPLPITELMVDATTGHEVLSFMDGSSGYNQIRMNPKDEEFTAFRTPKGIYCYKVMPFGLKNAGATYQRAMQKIFDDILHKKVECYVDDLVVETKNRKNHLDDLRVIFERLRRFQLKMNPLKCAFGVTSGKFLGFIVRHRGIEIDRTKIDAILKMPEPTNLHELKSLQGKLAYIRRFISNLAGRCHPFNKLMKKDTSFKWDDTCRNAFNNIKEYLLHPPVLKAPIPGRPLILYIAAQERSLGALLGQVDDEGKESASYYVSRTLVGAELNYSPIEKVCLALVFATKKLRHYMLAHVIHLISKADPLKFIMSRPVLSGRLAKWALLLSEFDITFVPQKAIKGQALADFLADHPIPAEWELPEEFPDEEVFFTDVIPSWKLFFDGAARKYGAGAGVVFVTPQNEVMPFSFTLMEMCSNNVAEYQALIIGLEMALEMQLGQLEIFRDSKLVINQLLSKYEVRKINLIPYQKHAAKLLEKFDMVNIIHVPRNENRQADALANLAIVLANSDKDIAIMSISQKWVIPSWTPEDETEVHNISVDTTENEDWRQPIIDFLKYGKLPSDHRHKTEIRRRASRFIYYKDTLYRRSFDGVFLRCLSKEEANQVLEEAHSGICGAHQSGPKLHFRIKRMGYYWSTMVKDSMEYAKRCEACQVHANFIHQPPEPLHPTVASWPFDAWGLDVVGPITPKSSAGHLYILAATDYFSRWAEALPLKEVKKETVVNFIQGQIIYRYGVPRYIITDNGKPFYNNLMDRLCQKFHFVQHNSSMYNAAANGLAEAFNKTLCTLLKKVVSKSKRDWHERVGEALWAYQITYRTPTQATPYSLVYGVEAVIPLECQIPSLRIAIQEGLTTEQNAQLRLEELESLDERRLEAQKRLECYQARANSYANGMDHM